MFTVRNRWVLVGSMFLLLFGAALRVHGENTPAASGPPDATLFTTYTLDSLDKSVSWIVCGSTVSTEGCYAAGNLGPFGRAGGLMEGNASVNLHTNTVTRAIYIVDIASGRGGNGVVLYVYRKTDVVSSTSDTVTVSLTKTIKLPLAGGSTALCSMAANNSFLFIGTDNSPQAVRVQKRNFTVTQVGGFSPPINVTAITADQYGYVTVTQGGFSSGENGFYVFGPDGGGADFMLNNAIAVSTTTLPKSNVDPAQRLEVRPKPAPQQADPAD